MKRCVTAVLAGIFTLFAAPVAMAADGKVIYAQTCAQCHANGVAGAPRTGDKAAWVQRLAVGRDTMLTTVLRGRGAMPPKGGNASLSDADAKSAMDYMLSQTKGP